MKKLSSFSLALLTFFLFSCGEKFLEEVDYTGNNTAILLQTEDGFEALMNGAYVTLRALYGKENYWDFTSSGTDLYTYGADARGYSFCAYELWKEGEAESRLFAMWREFYKSLNHNNFLLENLDKVPFIDPAKRTIREGEIRFLRAHTLYWIVETWGGVHLSTEYINTYETEAHRSSVEEFYEVILNDLEIAVDLLPAEQDDYGRINKPIAQAFLAKMYLTRGDYTRAESLADAVINNYDYALVDTWTEIFDFYQQDNSEVVWPIVYSSDFLTANGNIRDPYGEIYGTVGMIQRMGGHQGHCMFAIRYGHTAGMERALPYHRGFVRFCPTRFFVELFDETIDQRFYGSFRSHWLCNAPNWAPVWPLDDPGTPEDEGVVYLEDGSTYNVPVELQGQLAFNEGDTAMKLLKHPVDPSTRFYFSSDRWGDGYHIERGYMMYDINDMYYPDGTVNWLAPHGRLYYFPIILKYSAPDRIDVSQMSSGRHAFAIRISDMYLVSAEAALMQSNSGKAYERLEDIADARAVGNSGAALLSAYGVNGPGDVDIDFILDERARDLATEDYRFFDLKRTGKLEERIQAHNPEAAIHFQPYHALRPIPQMQLNSITNRSEFQQNPGYE